MGTQIAQIRTAPQQLRIRQLQLNGERQLPTTLKFPKAVAVAVRSTCVICVLLGGPNLLTAQGTATIRGNVIQTDGATRAVGVLVVAVDSGGAEVSRSLSGSTGNYLLTVPAPATYVIRALRIGFRPTVIPTITVTAGQLRTLDISLAGEALRLAIVRVESQASCRIRSDSGQLVARLWEQATGALAASTLTSGGGTLTSTLGQFRQFTPVGESTIQSDSLTVFQATPGKGFVSVPAETLAVSGYVVVGRSRVAYHAPDANALLSPSFAAGHCFTVRPAPLAHPEWVGIGFTPARDRRVPEIAGTLWLDRESAELRRLEFEYVNLPRSTAFGDAYGWVQFRHLDTGDWIISRWAIRYPETEQRIGGSPTTRYAVTGSRVMGGLTLSVTHDGTVLHRDDGASLRVLLRTTDSVNTWQRATIMIVGTNRAAVADSVPEVTFTGMAAGRFRLQVITPFMQSIGAPAQRMEVEVSFDSLRTVSVVLPTLEEVANRKCGAFGSLAYGTVSYSDGRPIAQARLELRWTEAVPNFARGRTQQPRTEEREIVRQADDSGRWNACIPLGRLIRAHVSTDGDDWAPQVLQLRNHRVNLVMPVRP